MFVALRLAKQNIFHAFLTWQVIRRGTGWGHVRVLLRRAPTARPLHAGRTQARIKRDALSSGYRGSVVRAVLAPTSAHLQRATFRICVTLPLANEHVLNRLFTRQARWGRTRRRSMCVGPSWAPSESSSCMCRCPLTSCIECHTWFVPRLCAVVRAILAAATTVLDSFTKRIRFALNLAVAHVRHTLFAR